MDKKGHTFSHRLEEYMSYHRLIHSQSSQSGILRSILFYNRDKCKIIISKLRLSNLE